MGGAGGRDSRDPGVAMRKRTDGEMVGRDLCWQRSLYCKFGAQSLLFRYFYKVLCGTGILGLCLYYVLHDPVRFRGCASSAAPAVYKYFRLADRFLLVIPVFAPAQAFNPRQVSQGCRSVLGSRTNGTVACLGRCAKSLLIFVQYYLRDVTTTQQHKLRS